MYSYIHFGLFVLLLLVKQGKWSRGTKHDLCYGAMGKCPISLQTQKAVAVHPCWHV